MLQVAWPAVKAPSTAATDAVMTAVPAETAVMRPAALTVATAVLLDEYRSGKLGRITLEIPEAKA